MYNHCILSTACPQTLGSLRLHLPKLPLQHFKYLKSCYYWTAWGAHPLAAPMQLQERVQKSFLTTYISLPNSYKSSSGCRGQLQAQLLGGIEINASCWEGGNACEHPRGELLQGSVGPAAVGQLYLTVQQWSWQPGSWEQGPFTPMSPTAVLLPESKLLEKATPVTFNTGFLSPYLG